MAIEEYKEVSASIRQYGDKRFSQLTFISAITGAALLGVRFINNETVTSYLIPLVVVIFTCAVWVMEESSTRYWKLYRNRAIELEDELEFNHYSLVEPKRLLSATNAVRIMYLSFIICWVSVLVSHIFL